MTHRAQSTFPNLTGDNFRGMLIAATASLELNAPIANSLNVFPVPDGDTGTNMYLTLKSAQPALDELKDATGDKVAQAVAYETLMGARGNSGVIMSQFFRGLAEGFKNRESFSAEDVSRAFDQASQASYKAVGNPVEGTMLTVIRKAAEEAGQRTASGEDNPVQVLSYAYEAACQALLETPELLLKLKEAGVVDAGGLGIVAIIDGMICYLNGKDPKILDIDVGQAAPSAAYLDATEQEEFGYCTQFLLSDFALDVAEIRGYLEEKARSTVVVGMEDVIKVHFHTEEPEAIVDYARSLGSVSQLKMEDMDRQHRGFLEGHRRDQQEEVPLGVVVVASGSGIEQIFIDLGAVDIVRGGQTMNPSAKELSDSAAHSAAAEVILLPNNSNIVPRRTASRLSIRKTRPRSAHHVRSPGCIRFAGLRPGSQCGVQSSQHAGRHVRTAFRRVDQSGALHHDKRQKCAPRRSHSPSGRAARRRFTRYRRGAARDVPPRLAFAWEPHHPILGRCHPGGPSSASGGEGTGMVSRC